MRIDDLIVLARTVPEESKKYGRRVCLAGMSKDLGLVRVYPLTVDNPLRSRREASLEVERNPDDSRYESFKLKDAVGSILSVTDSPVLGTSDVCSFAEKTSTTIARLNEQRKSLGFVQVIGCPEIIFRTRESIPDPDQRELWSGFMQDLAASDFRSGPTFRHVPYLRFKDAGGWHELQFREWGAYEYLRKINGKGHELSTILKLPESRDFFVFVGNMTSHRSAWMVLQLFSRNAQQMRMFAS